MDSGVVNGFVGRLSDDPADTDMIPDAVFGSHNVTECEEVFLTRINSSGIVAGFCWADDRFVERGLLLTPIIED